MGVLDVDGGATPPRPRSKHTDFRNSGIQRSGTQV
jgi:hypothetical protein